MTRPPGIFVKSDVCDGKAINYWKKGSPRLLQPTWVIAIFAQGANVADADEASYMPVWCFSAVGDDTDGKDFSRLRKANKRRWPTRMILQLSTYRVGRTVVETRISD